MLRCLFPFAVVFFLAGCVPVTEPLSDASTSEPDMRLVGKWKSDKFYSVTIDVPAVKGNPKGLMRATSVKQAKGPFWFHTTTIKKQTFANIYRVGSGEIDGFEFAKEGEFQKRLEAGECIYFVLKLSIKDDKFVMSAGNGLEFKELMEKENIKGVRNSNDPINIYYKTPAGWFANFLEKNNPEKIYDGSDAVEYQRVKN